MLYLRTQVSALRYSTDELEMVARTVFGEARGESVRGQEAVAWTIRNRVERPRWWGKDLISVCRRPYQYSCWLPDDPNLAVLKAGTFDHPAFRVAWAVATYVLEGLVEDPTHGATHYHTLGVRPSWADSLEVVLELGRHRFYRAE